MNKQDSAQTQIQSLGSQIPANEVRDRIGQNEVNLQWKRYMMRKEREQTTTLGKDKDI